MVKHYSNNIQNVIQGELFAASQSIKIAVAWFTNDLLFQPLLLKLATGVKIDIILNKDEINLSSSINFNLFVQQGGNLYWNESNRLMHDKFCIIDDRVVITGSYNWTNKAEINYESISVFTDEQESLRDYNARFQSLTRNFAKQTAQHQPQPTFHRDKCPISLQPYPKLKFYHSIKLFKSENTPILANQYEGGPYALLDNKTFLPRTQFMFSDYSSFIPGYNFLWLKGETKWGLFDCKKLEFVVKPQFNWISASAKNGTIVQSNGQYGLVSNGGKILLPCDYDEITNKENYFVLRQGSQYGFYDEQCDKIIKPKYDRIELKTDGVRFPYYILTNGGKYGVYILKYNGSDKLIDCKYDKITYSEPLGYPILHLQCNSNHSAYVFDSKIEIGGEDCIKIVFGSKFDYKILVLQYANGLSCLYIFGDKIKLSSRYDKITYEENLIYLEKSGKKGVYILGHKKEFNCIYDSIFFDKPFGKGVLRMQRRKSSYGTVSHNMCYDIYVLDSNMEIGGDWCVDVKYETPCVSKMPFGGIQPLNYTAIVMKTDSKKHKVYINYGNRLINGEYDSVSLLSHDILLYTHEPKLETLYYKVKYGVLEREEDQLFYKLKQSGIFETPETPEERRRREFREEMKRYIEQYGYHPKIK